MAESNSSVLSINANFTWHSNPGSSATVSDHPHRSRDTARAMSQENVEILRKLQNDWNRGERDLAGAYHPDVEFLPRRAATEGGYYGLSGIEAFIADTSEIFDKYEMNFEFTDLGERVLAFGAIHVRAKGSGVETDIQTGGLFEFRDGRIVRWEDFGSKSKALEAAGLSV